MAEARAVHTHSRANSFFSIFRKQSNGTSDQTEYEMKNLDVVISNIKEAPDTYLSQCSFLKKSRRTVDLDNLGCAFVDIDCYKMGIVPDEDFVSSLLDKAIGNGLPHPSYIMYSGRGIYLKWLFTEAVSAVNLHRWNALQHVLISLYRSIGGDMAARDASRVLRVLGSTNSTAGGSGVEIAWQSGIRHDFNELIRAVSMVDLPDIQENTKAQIRYHQARVIKLDMQEPSTALEWSQQHKAGMAHMKNFTARHQPIMMGHMSLLQLNWQRFIDLRDLSIQRGGIQRGSRDLTLFWMGNFLSHSGIITPDNFHQEMADLATGFPGSDFTPMEDGSMSTLFSRLEAFQQEEKVAFNGQSYASLYTPTNEKLIDIFEITDEEQKNLSTIINGREKRVRSDSLVPGRAERRDDRIKWRQEATNLAALAKKRGQEPNITEIATLVGIHKTQVSRLLAKKIGQPRKKRAVHHRRYDASDTHATSYKQIIGIKAGLAAAGRLVQPDQGESTDPLMWSFHFNQFVFPTNPYIDQVDSDPFELSDELTQEDLLAADAGSISLDQIVAGFALTREEKTGEEGGRGKGVLGSFNADDKFQNNQNSKIPEVNTASLNEDSDLRYPIEDSQSTESKLIKKWNTQGGNSAASWSERFAKKNQPRFDVMHDNTIWPTCPTKYQATKKVKPLVEKVQKVLVKTALQIEVENKINAFEYLKFIDPNARRAEVTRILLQIQIEKEALELKERDQMEHDTLLMQAENFAKVFLFKSKVGSTRHIKNNCRLDSDESNDSVNSISTAQVLN